MSTRKDFLAVGALAALAPTTAKAIPVADNKLPPFAFDRAAFDAIVKREAKHRHSFSATKLAKATVLDAIENTLEAYDGPLHEPISTVSTAAILYHGASIVLALNDDAWNHLIVPAVPQASESLKTDLSTVTAGKGNPYLHPSPDTEVSVEALVAKGTTFFVCNNAFSGFAQLIAKATKRPAPDVYADMRSKLVKGAMLVPAGVWAVAALQEAGYTYLQTTL